MDTPAERGAQSAPAARAAATRRHSSRRHATAQPRRWLLCTLAALAASCSGGGSGSTSSGGGSLGESSLTGNLAVVETTPADGATEVGVDARVIVVLDGIVDAVSLQDPGSYLATASGERVAGVLSSVPAQQAAVFTPAAPLSPATDYVFRLSELTCDVASRILDQPLAISFRTIDRQPPVVLAASISPGQQGVGRTDPVVLTFDERLAPTSVAAPAVELVDSAGASWPVTLQLEDDRLVVAPLVDLAGGVQHRLVLLPGSGGVADLAGNALAAAWSIEFRTVADVAPPSVVGWWPAAGATVSPLAHLSVELDESIDLATAAAPAVELRDELGNAAACAFYASPDHRTLHVAPANPLVAGRAYTLTASSGAVGLADLSGNRLAQPAALTFQVGADATPPVLVHTTPAEGATDVSRNAKLVLEFDEALDEARVAAGVVALREVGAATPAPAEVTLAPGGRQICVRPTDLLTAGEPYSLTIRGGAEGLRDAAGNPLATDLSLGFRTTDDPTVPTVLLSPSDGHGAVPSGAGAVAVFDQPIDPASVHQGSVCVEADGGGPVPGELSVERQDRVVRFLPTSGWQPGTWYTFTVRGGADGVRESSGNTLGDDCSARFRIAYGSDVTPPVVTATLNGTDLTRVQSMTVPPAGFAIDVTALDPEQTADIASADVVLRGAGPVPSAEQIFAAATLTRSQLALRIAAAEPLPPGDYRLDASVADLSGNRGSAKTITFQVRDPDPGALPFERTQVVWVRFDLDRDGNGRGDFEDDLLRLGLNAAGDPAATNERMLEVVQAGVLAQAHSLLGRDPSGAPLGPDAAPLRLTCRPPLGVVHSEIACGGFDPEGMPNRSYGSESSGVLGRAFFDYRNAAMNDHNTASRPGLGVFPAELFLFETEVHMAVFPSFMTSFARGFLPLVPEMGGTPAGSHFEDATVLAAGFDPTTATSSQLARYTTVFRAADDWATAIGIILAHEIGHAVGLTAEGDNPRGLHGDSSLHNAFSSYTDVMGSAVGYDSLVTHTYSFRDLNITYLRQRLLMK